MIVGISGPSNSGKTTLSHEVAAILNAPVISLDDYFYKPGRPSPYRNTVQPYDYYPEFDRYDAVDWESAVADVDKAPGNVVIEGFLLLGHKRLRDRCDITAYIGLDEKNIRQRRLVREPTIPIEYLDQIVLPRNHELVVPTSSLANVILDGTMRQEELFRQMFSVLVEQGLYDIQFEEHK